MTIEEMYMHRCIQLARNGVQGAPPNPMVGAVIVCNDRIIGEGYHAVCGQGHAEVNAIASVKDECLLSESTLYVSLEPCSHFGKTPPCADLIISKHIPRVVVGCLDPFPKVSGRGIRKLLDAGCAVTVGVLENECRELNKKFLMFHQKRRPFVTLKWAESADGYIDTKCRECGKPTMLSSSHTQLMSHKLRAENAAIMVGTNTALLDNPRLNTRKWSGSNPLRVVLDRNLRLPSSLNLLDGSIPTLVLTAKTRESRHNLEYRTIDFGKELISEVMDTLYNKGVQSLIVEGGARLLQTFIDCDLWDEAYIEKCPQILHEGVAAPALETSRHLSKYLQIMGRSYVLCHNFV